MKAARENKLMPKKLFPSAVEKTHHGSEAEKKVQSQRKLSQRTKLQQRKFNNERGAKLFKVSNVTEQEYSNIDQEEKGTWVQCCSENCCKWRYLDYLEDPQLVPDNWVCSMSQDREYNSCDIPEVKYDESEHIYTKFTTGSIVWAKVDGYPWWPAMVEIDPDYDTYFELQSETSMLPTQFHVSFFDDQVTRAWIKTSQLTPYNTGQIHGRKFSCGNHLYKREIEAAIKNAESALDLCLQDRIGIYGFEKRYKRRSRCSKHDDGSKTSTRKRQELKDHKKNSKSGTKMTLLSGVHQVEEGEGLDHNKQGNRLFGAKSEDVSFKSIHMNKALSTDSKKFKKLQYSEKAVLFEENVNSESKKIRKETTENERTDTTKDDNRPTQRDDEDANTMLVNTVNDPETNHNLDQKSGRIRQYLKRKQETSTLNDIDQPAEKNDFMHEENTANLISTKNMSQNNIDVNVQHLGVRVDINSSNALTETENTKHETTGSNFCQNVSDSVKQLKEKEQGRKNMRKRADDNPNIRSGFDETLSHHEGFNSSSSHPVNTLKKKKDKTVLEKKNAISAKSGKCNITSKDKYNSRKKVKGIFIKESVELYALPKQTVLMERVDSSQQKNMCKNHSEIENTKQINKKQVVSCTSLNEKGRKNNSTKHRHDNSHDEQNRAEKNASHDKKVKVKKSTLVCAVSKTNSAAFKRTVRTDRKVPVIMKMPTNSKKAKISLDNDQHIVPDIEMDISLTAHIESDSGQLGDEATIDSCDEENEIDLNLDYVKKGDNNNDDHSSLGLDIDDCEEPVVFENLKENQDIGRFAGKCCEHNSYSDPLELIED